MEYTSSISVNDVSVLFKDGINLCSIFLDNGDLIIVAGELWLDKIDFTLEGEVVALIVEFSISWIGVIDLLFVGDVSVDNSKIFASMND